MRSASRSAVGEKFMKTNQRFNRDFHGLFMGCPLSSDNPVGSWGKAKPSLEAELVGDAEGVDFTNALRFACGIFTVTLIQWSWPEQFQQPRWKAQSLVVHAVFLGH